MPNNNRSCIQDFFPGISHGTEQWLGGCLAFLSDILTFPEENLGLLISGVNISHPFVFSQLFCEGFEIFMFYLIKLFQKSSAAVGSAAVPVIWGAGQKSLLFPLNTLVWEVFWPLFRALSISSLLKPGAIKSFGCFLSSKREERALGVGCLWGFFLYFF